MPKGGLVLGNCSQRRVRIARHPFDRFVLFCFGFGWLVCLFMRITKVHTYEIDGSDGGPLERYSVFVFLEMARLMDARDGVWMRSSFCLPPA